MRASDMDPSIEARRAIASGGALWREGLVPEAHGYMAGALRAALRAWLPTEKGSDPGAVAEPSRQNSTDESEAAALAALARAGYRDLDRLREALAATAGLVTGPAPKLDAASIGSDFEWIWTESERLSRFTRRRLMSPRARKRARLRLAVALGVICSIGVAVLVRLWGGPTVTASAVFSSEHPASYAADGMESTEWVLPDYSPGWVQLGFRSPRRVRGVRLVNAHNKHYMDRGSKKVRVTAYSDHGQVASAEGAFADIEPLRSVLDLPVKADRVTRIRVEIVSYFAAGGALAEIEVM